LRVFREAFADGYNLDNRYASATSIAAQSTTETGPVGAPTSSANSNPKTNGAVKLGSGLMTGVMAILTGVVVGGGWVVL
jgi:hypothetical protein